jgi:hypothetical protein
MTKHLITFLAAAAFAACGSKQPPAPTTPAEPAHEHADGDADHPHEEHDHAGSGSAATTEPEKPVEQAPPAKDPKVELMAAEAAAWDTAKPVLEKACASCHTAAGKKSAKKKLDHFNMDTYPLGGHHTATIGFTIREVLGIGGKKPTMPYDKPGSVKGDDLAKIEAWTDAWEAAEKGGAHPAVAHHDDHDH